MDGSIASLESSCGQVRAKRPIDPCLSLSAAWYCGDAMSEASACDGNVDKEMLWRWCLSLWGRESKNVALCVALQLQLAKQK